jgi:protein-S-isoprenylcysteine O-methyltransferase Ste14
MLIAAIVFLVLFFISAPYGRYTNKSWGFLMNPKLMWFAVESPAAVFHFLFWATRKTSSLPINIFSALFVMHYVQRSIVFPLLMSSSAKRMPISVGLMAILFNSLNGFINGYGLYWSAESQQYLSSDYLLQPNFLIGIVIFFVGMYINISSDQIVRNLRREGENDYKVPNEGLHRLVASPNYFGEIIEWCGWAILTWSLCGLAFAVFTFANLVPRAVRHRKWYADKFKEEYPASRKAELPCLV